jgi:tetratricopeptide (TPR) repeat protein
LGDEGGQADALRWLAKAVEGEPQFKSLTEQSLAIARRIGDPNRTGLALYHLGQASDFEEGHREIARMQYQEALALFEQAGNTLLIAQVYINLSGLALAEENALAARSFAERSLALYTALDSKLGRIMALANLAHAYALQGDYPAAERVWHESLRRARDLGAIGWIAQILDIGGDILRAAGNYAGAEAAYLEGLELTQRTNNQELSAHQAAGLGRVRLQQQQFAQAAALFAESLVQAMQIANPPLACLISGVAALALGRGAAIQAARWVGVVEQLSPEQRGANWYLDRRDYERDCATLQHHLDAATLSAALAAGRVLAPEAATAEVLAYAQAVAAEAAPA